MDEKNYRMKNSLNICIKPSTAYSHRKVRKIALNRLACLFRVFAFSNSMFHRLKIIEVFYYFDRRFFTFVLVDEHLIPTFLIDRQVCLIYQCSRVYINHPPAESSCTRPWTDLSSTCATFHSTVRFELNNIISIPFYLVVSVRIGMLKNSPTPARNE